MNNFFVLLMNDWLMNLSDLFCVDNWLVIFMDNILMMLMNHITMVLMNNVLMMFMNNVPVMLLYNWLVNVLLNPGGFLDNIYLSWLFMN